MVGHCCLHHIIIQSELKELEGCSSIVRHKVCPSLISLLDIGRSASEHVVDGGLTVVKPQF